MKRYFDLMLSASVLAYFVYIQATGDNTLRRLREHGRYHLGRVRRWWHRQDEPTWYDELRKYDDESGYIQVDEP